MKSILLVSWANLRRRKESGLLIVISMTFSILLFSSSIALIQGIHKPFDVLFEKCKASHLLLFYDNQEVDEQAILDWFKNQDEVAAINPPGPVYSLSKPFLFKGREIDKLLQLTEHHHGHLMQDQVQLLDGVQKAHPDIREVWIPKHIAVNHAINVNDTIQVPTPEGSYDLVVGALVADPHYASSVMNPSRAWVASGALAFMLPLSSINQMVLGLRLHDAKQIDPLWLRFNQTFTFSGMMFSYDFYKSVFLSFYNILLGILFVFSILAFGISMFLLLTSISNAIADDYPNIGIYKVLGFSKGQVVYIYLFQYLSLLLIALGGGLGLGYLFTRLLLRSFIPSLGLINLALPFLAPSMITCLVFLFLASVLIFLRSRKAGNTHPIQAIRFGLVEIPPGRQLFFSLIHRYPLYFFLGIRHLLSHRRQVALTFFGTILTVFILVFSLDVSHSLSCMAENRAKWGFEEADLHIKRNDQIAIPLNDLEFRLILQNAENVEGLMPYGYITARLPISKEISPKVLLGKAFAGDLDKIGLTNLEGRHPLKDHEISLCILTAEDLQKGVGDSIELHMEGVSEKFLVSGVYQDIANLGQGFRLQEKTIKRLNPLYQSNRYAVRLKSRQKLEEMQSQYQRQLGETAIIELSSDQRKEVKSMVSGMKTSLWILSFIFLVIMAIVLFNDTLSQTMANKASWGILKALGFPVHYLRWSLLIRSLIIVTLSLVVGIPMAYGLVPILINGLTHGMGIPDFPLVHQLKGVIFIIPLLLVYASTCVYLASRRIHTIDPKTLIKSY